MRTSLYTIYVPLEDDGDRMLIVHGYSGAYDKVPRAVGDYLRSLEVKRAKPLHGEWRPEGEATPATPPSDETIAALKRRGYLTEKTVEEEQAFFDRVAGSLQRNAVEGSPPAWVVMPTYQCNLRCAYCFQDHMRTDPAYAHLLRWMSGDMVDRVLAGMAQIERERGVKEDWTRSILLFGGEPLLAEGKPSVLSLYERARVQRPTIFSAVTNGTEIHEYAAILGPGKLSSLQVTLDGAPAAHDRRRIHADGSGSFARIADNLTLALDLGVSISLRINVDRTNVGALEELAEIFIERGWSSHPAFSAYTAAVTGVSKDYFTSYALSVQMNQLKAQNPRVKVIDRPADAMRRRLLSVFRGDTHPRSLYQASFCGAHAAMHVIDPFGDIYACWDRTGDPGIRIGTIGADGAVTMFGRQVPGAIPHAAVEPDAGEGKRRVFLPTIKNTASPLRYTDVPGDEPSWRSRTVSTNQVCRSCRYAFHCGGGCAVMAVEHSGEFLHNHCDGFQESFRMAAREAHADHMNGVAPGAAVTVDCGR